MGDISKISVPKFSVITAVCVDRADYLKEAWTSLRDQIPYGSTSWEWCIQVDGTRRWDGEAFQDPRVKLEHNGGRAGTAASRNLALSRAQGAIVVTLDGDDLLEPNAFETIGREFDADISCDWIATNHRCINEDGTTLPYRPLTLGTLRVEAGDLLTHWDRLGHIPVIPHCVAYRRHALVSVGGWTALPRSEDTGAILAVSALGPGRLRDVVTHVYRHWSKQQTNELWINDESYLKKIGRDFIRERAKLLFAK